MDTCDIQRFVWCNYYVVINNVVHIHVHSVTVIRIILGVCVYKCKLCVFGGTDRECVQLVFMQRGSVAIIIILFVVVAPKITANTAY